MMCCPQRGAVVLMCVVVLCCCVTVLCCVVLCWVRSCLCLAASYRVHPHALREAASEMTSMEYASLVPHELYINADEAKQVYHTNDEAAEAFDAEAAEEEDMQVAAAAADDMEEFDTL